MSLDLFKKVIAPNTPYRIDKTKPDDGLYEETEYFSGMFNSEVKITLLMNTNGTGQVETVTENKQ